jgi:hypothetical protein
LRTLSAGTAAVSLFALVACGSSSASLEPLANDEFWRLSTSLSEAPGHFEQDNLVSNEALFAQFAQMLHTRGGAYVGVGPEQNFSYIARVEPALAFIVDIRRENLHLHLMYKALFAISGDRTGFLSRLFSRPRPPSVTRDTDVADLFAAFTHVPASTALFDETIQLVRHELLATRQLPLREHDMGSIEATLRAFLRDGPDIRYGRGMPPSRTRPTYRALMTERDLRGQPQSYLATDAAFARVKTLQQQNRVIPVTGDFAGRHALRAIGDVMRQQQLTLSVFYASNVEVYLSRDQRRAFCESLASLPHDDTTYFIGNRRLIRLSQQLENCKGIAPSLRWP